MDTTAASLPETGLWAALRALFAPDAAEDARIVAGWDGLPVQVVETPPRRVST